ncbi:hypothetical protein T492DRAFT_212029 [Pavlovales sp. CCMP2436]|nr:hypothetical protein T492DRAFT_212029 [Pavlovales sp. CCMP2436]
MRMIMMIIITTTTTIIIFIMNVIKINSVPYSSVPHTEMMYGADGKPMRLQAIEEIQCPINRHPESGKPVWFCNVSIHIHTQTQHKPNPSYRTSTTALISSFSTFPPPPPRSTITLANFVNYT